MTDTLSGSPPDTRSAERVLMVLPSERLVRTAAAAGCRVWSVWDPALRERAYLDEVARHSERLLLADLDDEAGLRALIARTAREHRVTHVLHLGGARAVTPVLAEAEALGLGANPVDAVRTLGDRGAMRELLWSYPRLRVRAERAVDAAAVRRAVTRFAGFPVVVKSAEVSGSCGATLLRGPYGLADWERAVVARGTPGPFLVEEYLPGPQYAVETLSVDGMHQVAGITTTRTTGPPHFETVSHVHPAPLGDRAEAEIRSAVCALLDLAGFENGPTHTTVVRTPDGIRVLASRAGLGGDGIPLLVELARGTDLEAESFRALTGGLLTPPALGRTAMAGFVRLPGARPPGGPAIDALRALPYVRDVDVRADDVRADEGRADDARADEGRADDVRADEGRARAVDVRAPAGLRVRVVVVGDGPGDAARHLAAARRLLGAPHENRPEAARIT
ncbi:ATP-grasp domain-containing protein [Streptomyces gobitricini]|uniref:ATP-grasp domain-containing protein n=1 Tax=Streptomyces gobitricini TaxID=68211 RepID=A0ABN3LKQ2_9ACTN